MSGAAAMKRARRTQRAERQRWDTPPHPNSHIVRYCARAQDPLMRKPAVRRFYDLAWHHPKATRLDRDRRVVRASIGDWTYWLGDELREEANPGQSEVSAEPIPRSTLIYWLDLLRSLHLIELFDEVAQKTRGPRSRGDGRHKSYWVINSFDRALDLICADPKIAIPKNRCFWTLDSWPVSAEVATERKLDVALAERLPDAWANNARSRNPYAPFKPMRRTETRRPTAAEIDVVHRVLTGKSWSIAATKEQAAEIIAWARSFEGAERVPADWIAEAIAYRLDSNARRWREKHPHGPDMPQHSVKFFDRESMRGLAAVWVRQKDEAAKNAAQDAVRVSPEPIHDGTDPDPPPAIDIPRKSFPS